MAFKERTSEFNSIVQNMKQRKDALPSTLSIRSKNNKKTHEKSEFFLTATQIGKDIGETAEKLKRLSFLAKKRSLFDDPTIEIQELTSIINQDIKNLNNQITVLQQRGSTKKNKQVQSHTDTILDTLKTKLRFTTKDFSEVLEVRTENLKTQQKEKENFSGTQSPKTVGTRSAISPLYKSNSNPQFLIDEGSSSDVVINMPRDNGLMMTQMTQDRYLSSRTDAVRSIESTITELQGIFQQLANLVVEQGELIERIDHNIEDASSNVNDAQGELLKYLSNISSNRWLIVKLFLALVFFIILFIVFFV